MRLNCNSPRARDPCSDCMIAVTENICIPAPDPPPSAVVLRLRQGSKKRCAVGGWGDELKAAARHKRGQARVRRESPRPNDVVGLNQLKLGGSPLRNRKRNLRQTRRQRWRTQRK